MREDTFLSFFFFGLFGKIKKKVSCETREAGANSDFRLEGKKRVVKQHPFFFIPLPSVSSSPSE